MTTPVRHMLLSVTLFALMGVCAKYLRHLPAMEIVFFRCLVSMVLSIYMLQKVGVGIWGQPQNRLPLWGRGVVGSMALFLYFLTLQNMPFATAVTIQYLSPIFASILATLVLGEKTKGLQWLFFLVSFAGTVLLKGFDERISWLYLGLGVLSAACSGVAYNFIRRMSGREHPVVIVFYFQIVGVLLGGAFTLFNFQVPGSADWAAVLGVGLFAHWAQIYLTKAIQGEKVGVVLSLVYIGAVYAAIFGWLLFGEYLTWGNILAIGLIISGVLLNLRTSGKSR